MEDSFEIKEGVAKVKINKHLYSKEVLLQTTYVLLEKFYFFIDINGEDFDVTIRGKEKKEVFEEDILIFFDELIESSAYIDQLKKTSKIREIILEKALLSQK